MDHYCPWTNNAIGVMNHKRRAASCSLGPGRAASARVGRHGPDASARVEGHTFVLDRENTPPSRRHAPRFFILFIGYTFALCVHALCILGGLLWAAPARKPRGRRRGEPIAGDDDGVRFDLHLATVAVVFAALLFGLFTACMLADQWSVLRTNAASRVP
jgi:hypothetical protein